MIDDLIFEQYLNETSSDLSAAQSADRATAAIDTFFERLELQQAVGRPSILGKVERAEMLGVSLEELEKRESAQQRPAVGRVPFSSLIDVEAVRRGKPAMRKAAGYLDHLYKKSATLDEALERAAELVSDDATPDQWRLLGKARAALDIAAFLTVLTEIFAAPAI